MEIVRLGIIGAGSMGTGHIANVLTGEIKNVEITAVCDVNPEKIEAAKTE